MRALGGVPDLKETRIYPLAQAAAAPDNQWVNGDTAFNTVEGNDFTFYEEVNELVQEETVEALDAERAGRLAAIRMRPRPCRAPQPPVAPPAPA